MEMRRVVVVGSAPGNGKTTLARELAHRLGVRFVELDGLIYGPGWTETPDVELRELVAPIVADDGWVLDGLKTKKLGSLVLGRADIVVWLDLPVHVWLPRLVRRTVHRVRSDEDLWNGNRERALGTLIGRNPLFVRALRSHRKNRRRLPVLLADYNVVRLRTPAEVDAFVAGIPELGPGGAHQAGS